MQRPRTKTCVCSNCSASRASLCTWYTVSSCRISVLKPKIMRLRLSPFCRFSVVFRSSVLSLSCQGQVRRMKLLLKHVLSLTHLPVKTKLGRSTLRLAQIIYIAPYAGQLFRSLPAPPDALRHRHGSGERDCDPFPVDWPA